MAVAFLTGFEGRALGLDSGPGATFIGAAAYSTAIKRTGGASLRSNPASGSNGYTGVNSTTSAYIHFALYVASLPSVSRQIYGSTQTDRRNLRLNSDGTLSWYHGATTLIATTAQALETGRWYWIGLRNNNGSSVVAIQIDGQAAATGDVTGVDSGGAIGCFNTEASAIDIYIDDYIEDDAQWLAPSKVNLLLPISDNARAALWTGGVGGTTNLYDAVNNTPPIGTATETDLTQIEHAGGAAGTTDAYDANMTTYTDAGISAADTVLAVQLVAVHGEDISTGAKLLAFSVVSNPAIAATGNITVGDTSPAALATYPTEWGIHRGAVAASPSVTLGTSPVMRALRPETASRVASVCFMGMLVAWTPAIAARGSGPRAALQAVHRAANW